MKISASMLALFVSVAAYGVEAASSPTAAADQSPQIKSAVGNDYVVGPGDELQIFVWRNPEITATVPVRPDGRISTPLVEEMMAAGKSPSMLARDIEKVLAVYVRNPQVNVIVTKPASVMSQVKIIGQVKQPGAIPFHEGMTVLDAVLAAGGLGEFAAANRARVVRMVDGRQQTIRVKLGALINGADLSRNVALLPGDVLLIPETRF